MQFLHLGADVGDAVDQSEFGRFRSGPERAGKELRVGRFELAQAALLDETDEDIVAESPRTASGTCRFGNQDVIPGAAVDAAVCSDRLSLA